MKLVRKQQSNLTVLLKRKKIMALAKELFLLFCFVSYSALCPTASYKYNKEEACVVQYLKAKGKLNEAFQSTVPTPSAPECQILVPSVVEYVRSMLNGEIIEKFPNELNCLSDEFNNKEGVDHLIKISVMRRSDFLSESDKRAHLIVSRNQLKDVLKEVAVQCLVEDKKFIDVFNPVLYDEGKSNFGNVTSELNVTESVK